VTDRRIAVPHALALLLVAVLLAGCGLMRRPEIHHYSLEVIAPAAPAVPAATAPGPPSAVATPPVGLAAIVLPPGLDRQEVAVRRDDGRLDVRGTELWAAPLETLVLHTLAFDLAGRLPEGAVVLPGQTQPTGGLRSLDVAFEELAAGPEPVLVLDARWTLRTPGAADFARRERIAEPLASLDSAEIAAGTSRALAELADRLVPELAR
jgi:uncharacterized lipoprotein YmbA